MKEPLLISACLMGADCKYNGENNYCPAVEALNDAYMLVPVCPERDGGLPIPRAPSERRGDRVINNLGGDVTEQFSAGARLALGVAKAFGCTKALLKENSPSCGCGTIYDGTFSGTLTEGDGVTAALLKENGIAVYGESDIDKLL